MDTQAHQQTCYSKIMNGSEDSDLFRALEGSGETLATLQLFCIKRDGYLLLALPRDAVAARATLGLYHPQANIAKLLVWVIGIMVRLRLHTLLPRIELTIRSVSPLARMLDDPGSIGFLLGNPSAQSRRAITLHRKNENLFVDKLGIGGGARELVIKELEHIRGLPENHVALPEVVDQDISDKWASYATHYLDGKSPGKSDDAMVIVVLQNWLEKSESIILNETRQWQQMVDYAEANQVGNIWSRLQKAAVIPVKVGVFHGDFAPWNVKVLSSGSVYVMDWELGCADGPAGWDWVHYIIQRATLVDHHGPSKVLDECRKWAKSQEGKEFLEKAGWGVELEHWLGSYLVYSAWISGFERDELLVEWMLE